MKLKSIPRRLGYILGAQWARDLAWAAFTILLARHSKDMLGQIMLALSYGYLVKTVADVGLNDFLLSTFARQEVRPRVLLSGVTLIKLALFAVALCIAWIVTGALEYAPVLRLTVLCVAAGFGLDAVSDSFFALCQARGRQDMEMRLRVPAALIGIGCGILCILLDAPLIVIAMYKMLESLICMALACFALGRNPLAGIDVSTAVELARRMKHGLVFTGMGLCAMFYNKINVFFLKQHGGNEAVGSYGVAWEMVEGLTVVLSGALLGKVIFPLLARLWKEDRNAFRHLSGQTARSLWAAALPIIFVICVESDRLLPLVYGHEYLGAATAQRLLTPCLATAFLHNLAAYAMIGMQRHNLLLLFYLSGLALNIVCCYMLIPSVPLEGAALALTVTKIWVALLTVSFFQWAVKPMTAGQWALLLATSFISFALWWGTGFILPREAAEAAGLIPLLALLLAWRPPAPFEPDAARDNR
ncbi:MAG: oligosaccharide flippase family protein [Desulfovibrio sp.]|jgi:O-antigen/teichoic acid export membrane protein|nr:oligosaccharide flippase family protein [Desulfovibrio sp.]